MKQEHTSCLISRPPRRRTEAKKLEASNPADVERTIERCVGRFGRLDYLVTAAVTFEDHPFDTMTDEQWHRTIAANLDSVIYACHRAVSARVMAAPSSISLRSRAYRRQPDEPR